MEVFGKQLRKRSKELGFSDAEVARRSGISERRYSNYVRNIREPDYATLLRICRTLNATPNELFGLTAPSKRNSANEKLIALCNTLHAADLELVINVISAISKTRR